MDDSNGIDINQDESGTVEAESTIAKVIPKRSKEELYLDQLQRLQAEFDNYRKRVTRERREWITSSKADLITQLLPIIDNFERAMGVPDIPDTILLGLEMVYKELLEVMAKEGVQRIETTGQAFNPSIHEAIAYQEDSATEGSIIAETASGYQLGTKLLRAAQVVVAKEIVNSDVDVGNEEIG